MQCACGSFCRAPIDARSSVLHERRGLGERTIRLYRQRRDAAGGIVGNQYRLARRIDVQITGRSAASGLPVQQLQFPGASLDLVRGDLFLVFAAERLRVNRVQKLLVLRHRQEEWILDAGCLMHWLEVAGLRFQLKGVNAAFVTGRKG